jgi:antitoxin MazE
MRVLVSKWGNSLGLRLPRSLAVQLGIRSGQEVNVVAVGAKLIVEPVAPNYRVEDLLANVTPEAMRGAFDWGDDAGRERVDG